MPPSITSSVPTMNADSATARYSTALAISSGVPKRLSGIWARILVRDFGELFCRKAEAV